METGIREAKSNLSKLVKAAIDGEKVFLTNRGERVVPLIAVPKLRAPRRGRGLWKGKVNLYPGWDSPQADKEIEGMFECFGEPRPR